MIVEFALTIEAESLSEALEIVRELEELRIIEGYQAGEGYIDTIDYKDHEFSANHATEPNIPSGDNQFDRKLIIGYRVSETPHADSIDYIQGKLGDLAHLKEDIENDSKYAAEEIVLRVSEN